MTGRITSAGLLLGLLAAAACSTTPGFPDPFFGETPGTTPVKLGRGVISMEESIEMGCTFTPDTSEFWFVRIHGTPGEGMPVLMVCRRGRDGWSAPEAAPFDPDTREFAPHITPDGERFLFYRQKQSDPEFRGGTWVVERLGGIWGEPQFYHEAYCIVQDLEGVLYFNSENRESTSRDIAVMSYEEDHFTEPEDLPGEANSIYWDAHPCVDPAGQFILFDSMRPDSLGGSGIYVSFRRPDGSWGPAEHLGDELRFDWGGNTPSLSPDGGYLLFHADGDLWWVSTEIIHRLQPEGF